jgi:demethylmenaquinone methyltransferase/2-methoxy-6-polyprenyl-1,4-benzoquinol methylase
MKDHDVLEVACGTGYWTEPISHSAKSVLATDVTEEVLEIARTKPCADNVVFQKVDAYTLERIRGEFSAAFCGFWWSHMPVSRIAGFLSRLHARLGPGALVVFCDNTYAAGSNTPISRTDAEGNTYQMRTLEDGSTHEVLKNFPTEAQVRRAVGGWARDLEYVALTYYWCLSYRAVNPQPLP